MSVAVTLNWHEVCLAAHVGLWRRINAVKQGKRDIHGYEGAGWDANIEGACGELAAAKALGRYWDGSVETWKRPDIGDLQIRTRSQSHYGLLVRPDDDDDDIFVLVTGKCPEFTVRGWLHGRDSKRQQWLNEHGGRPAAYFVPQSSLRPLSELEMR